MKIELEQAEKMMEAVVAHMKDGGSFRYFIYDRLGLDSGSYAPMYNAGGMVFTNACPVNLEKEFPVCILHFRMGKVHEIDEETHTVYIPTGSAMRVLPWDEDRLGPMPIKGDWVPVGYVVRPGASEWIVLPEKWSWSDDVSV